MIRVRFLSKTLLFTILISSCNFEEVPGDPRPVTKPFPACEEGNLFIKLGKTSISSIFFMHDSLSWIYSSYEKNLYKYTMPYLEQKKVEGLPEDVNNNSYCQRNEVSSWVITVSKDWTVRANAVDTELNVILTDTVKLMSAESKGYKSFRITDTSDQGFLLAAKSVYLDIPGNPSARSDKFNIYRYSETANLEWKKEMPGTVDINCMLTLKSGGFLIGGSRILGSPSVPVRDFLTKLGEDGKVKWTKTSNIPPLETNTAIVEVIEDPSGDYLVLAKQQSSLYLIRTDSAFNQRWITSVSSVGNEFIGGSKLLSVADRVLVAFTGGFLANGKSDIFFAGYTPTGTLIWNEKYEGGGDEEIFSILSLPSEGYYLIGIAKTYNRSYTSVDNILLIKTDLNGKSCN